MFNNINQLIEIFKKIINDLRVFDFFLFRIQIIDNLVIKLL